MEVVVVDVWLCFGEHESTGRVAFGRTGVLCLVDVVRCGVEAEEMLTQYVVVTCLTRGAPACVV